jgi:hypothetical protein
MKALSLQEPFASLVCNGRKRVENRSWAPPASLIGERIAIHRSGPNGAIIATARIVGVVVPEIAKEILPVDQEGHICGPLCWLLDDVRKLRKPVVFADQEVQRRADQEVQRS